MRRSWVQIPSRPPDSAQRTQLSRTTIERGRKRAVTASQVSSISEFESFTCSDRLCLAKTYPDLGSTAHSRRTAQAGFRSLGKECLAMDPASSERSRSREALADVPQKPSRGHCCNGFLHRPNAHVWCSVLLFRHRPRPAEDPAFQCDAKSQCTLGCTAIARSMGLPTAAQILAIRPRRKVWSRGAFGGEGHGKRANSNGLSQSVGRTVLRSAGWEVADATCWTM